MKLMRKYRKILKKIEKYIITKLKKSYDNVKIDNPTPSFISFEISSIFFDVDLCDSRICLSYHDEHIPERNGHGIVFYEFKDFFEFIEKVISGEK